MQSKNSTPPFKFEAWPTEYQKITQHFGANPLNYAQFGLPGHEGIDIRAPSGSKIFCVAPGQIFKVHTQAHNHNYGIHIRVNHADGYQTIYAHLQEALVQEDMHVSAGHLLGLADNTGNSFGAHLHLTLKRQNARYKNWPYNIIDPTPFLLPLLGWQEPAGPFETGWVLASSVLVRGSLAQANPGGITLRIRADHQVVIPGGTIMILLGKGDNNYLSVKVPQAALGSLSPPVTQPSSPPPPISLATVDGWAWAERLHLFDNQAVVKAHHGINLRSNPNSQSLQIGIIRAGSTVSLLGDVQDEYLPIRVRRSDFIGPIHTSEDRPITLPDSLDDLPEDVLLGWTQTHYLQHNGRYAFTRHRGLALRNQPSSQSDMIGTVKGDAPVTIAGGEQNEFTPILVHNDLMFSLVNPNVEVMLPHSPPEDGSPLLPPSLPIQNTVPGWGLTSSLIRQGDHSATCQFPVRFREQPKRDARLLAVLPVATNVMVMGLPLGEYTPIRVAEALIQTSDSSHANNEDDDLGILGQAHIGLHASADPDILEDEFQEFQQLRPGIIKVLSFHNPAGIARLAHEHPQASWIVRAFLDFGGRKISPTQFLQDTQSDMSRTLKVLAGKKVVIELHNEPNLIQEGLGSSWDNGRDFADWWLDLLHQYKQAFPDVPFIYPGLSPGSSVLGQKIDHIQFIEASRTAVEAADGLGVHLYWSAVYPMSRTVDVLDDYISRFRNKPIWVTEASNNKSGTAVAQKAQEYLKFWYALQQRPIVQGVTYFVASASNPAFAEEVWVGRGLGKLIGAR